MSRLFVVATPIGNLDDLSPRARETLAGVPLIAAEDTRVARVMLSRFGIRTRLISYNEDNREARIPVLLRHLEQGDLALVSDAGTPGISDPGAELVGAARQAGHEVVAVPGPSAVAAALSVCGLRCARYCFSGFLPRSVAELKRLLGQRCSGGYALVAFESPQRLRKSLAVIAEALPDRRLAVCRELTKLHEEVFVGTAFEALRHFEQPRGEIVLVIEAASKDEASVGVESREADMTSQVAELRRLGLTANQGVGVLQSLFGLSRRRAYQLWLVGRDSAPDNDLM